MLALEIHPEDLDLPEVRALIARHVSFARGQTPPEDAHALDIAGLVDPSVSFFGCRTEGDLLGIGALKMLDDHHAEVKSMHTAEHARGRGIGRAIVQHLLEVARSRGVRRVSLETGSMEAFAPARRLYERAGFAPCAPFGDYVESPNSVYMTIALDGLQGER